MRTKIKKYYFTENPRDGNKLNIYIKANFIFSSELVILSGLLDNYPKESPYSYNNKKESRYGIVKDLCKEKINIINSPEESDILVLPYKFRGVGDSFFKELETLSNQHDKKLLCFYNDDNTESYQLSDNIILYRTSYYKSKIISPEKEKCIPAFIPDYFENNYLTPSLTIGFCGHVGCGRKKYIDLLSQSDITTNFITRDAFLAQGLSIQAAIREYFENMKNNLFIFCYRGKGNFSYRFYETLMMGRIPILINTDCLFPFIGSNKIEDLGLIIDEKDLESQDLIQLINEYYSKNLNRLEEIQISNRKIWETYFSAWGFIENIALNFNEN